MEGPGADVSHAWTHTPRGLLCLVPSLRPVGSGLSRGDPWFYAPASGRRVSKSRS